jgi:hypothetical protein
MHWKQAMCFWLFAVSHLDCVGGKRCASAVSYLKCAGSKGCSFDC